MNEHVAGFSTKTQASGLELLLFASLLDYTQMSQPHSEDDQQVGKAHGTSGGKRESRKGTRTGKEINIKPSALGKAGITEEEQKTLKKYMLQVNPSHQQYNRKVSDAITIRKLSHLAEHLQFNHVPDFPPLLREKVLGYLKNKSHQSYHNEILAKPADPNTSLEKCEICAKHRGRLIT